MAGQEDAELIANLKAENEALSAEIKQMKAVLGLDQIERIAEQKRIRSLFDLYDADKSGFIDKAEFQGLAAHCGLILPPDALNKALSAINSSGDGKISFADFTRWVQSVEQGELTNDVQERDLARLKVKLQAQNFFKSAGALQRQVSARMQEQAGEFGKQYFKLKVGSETVGLDAPNLSIKVDYTKHSAEDASALRAAANAADYPTLAYIDLIVAPTASDESLGELAGSLSQLLDGLLGSLPLPVEIEHEEIVVEVNGERVLRLVFKVQMDVLGMVQAMAGVDPLEFLQTLSIVVESALGLSDLKEEDCNLLNAFKHRVLVDVSIDQAVVDIALDMVPFPDAASKVGFLGAKIFKNFELMVKTFDPVSELSEGGSLSFVGEMLEQFPAPLILAMWSQTAPNLVAEVPPPFQPLYTLARDNLLGVRGLQLVANEAGLRLALKGLDFVPFLPALDAQLMM